MLVTKNPHKHLMRMRTLPADWYFANCAINTLPCILGDLNACINLFSLSFYLSNKRFKRPVQVSKKHLFGFLIKLVLKSKTML